MPTESWMYGPFSRRAASVVESANTNGVHSRACLGIPETPRDRLSVLVRERLQSADRHDGDPQATGDVGDALAVIGHHGPLGAAEHALDDGCRLDLPRFE